MSANTVMLLKTCKNDLKMFNLADDQTLTEDLGFSSEIRSFHFQGYSSTSVARRCQVDIPKRNRMLMIITQPEFRISAIRSQHGPVKAVGDGMHRNSLGIV